MHTCTCMDHTPLQMQYTRSNLSTMGLPIVAVALWKYFFPYSDSVLPVQSGSPSKCVLKPWVRKKPGRPLRFLSFTSFCDCERDLKGIQLKNVERRQGACRSEIFGYKLLNFDIQSSRQMLKGYNGILAVCYSPQ